MKREHFQIRIDGMPVSTKFAWNTAWREPAKILRNAALPIGMAKVTYFLTEKKTEKDNDGYFFKGFQIWQCKETSKQVKFEIERI